MSRPASLWARTGSGRPARTIPVAPCIPALRLRGLRAGHGHRQVFGGLDLDLDAGLVHGIIGPNGAGKSTLLKACLGLVPSFGQVIVHGHELAQLTALQRAHLMSYLPQDIANSSTLTAAAYVQLGRYARRSRFDRSSAADGAAVAQALEMTGAQRWALRPVAQLSGGERQLVALARAIAQDSAVLMLDEPSSALDLGHELAVLRLLRPWIDASATDHSTVPPRTAVLVLHDLTLAARFCDRLHLLVDGRLLASGRPAEVLTEEHLAASYGIDVAITTVSATGTLAVTPL